MCDRGDWIVTEPGGEFEKVQESFQSRKPFLKSGFVPKRSLLDGLRADRRGSITAVQPDPFVLPRDRDERAPSRPVRVQGVVPNDVVVRLTVAVSGMVSAVGQLHRR